MKQTFGLAFGALVVGVALITVAGGIAFGQEALGPIVIAAAEPSLLSQLVPLLVGIAAVVLSIATPFIVQAVRQRAGDNAAKTVEEIANLLQARLQGGVGRGAGLVINAMGVRAVNEEVLTNAPEVTKAVQYLRETLPDTLKELGLDTTKGEQLLRKMVVAQVGEKVAPGLATSAEAVAVAGDAPVKPGLGR